MRKKICIKYGLILTVGIFLGLIVSYINNNGVFTYTDYSAVLPEEVRGMAPSDEMEYWISYIESTDAQQAYTYFGEIYDQSIYTVQHSHAHVFGEALYKTTGIEGVSVCDSNYGFGCYHSFFGWALNTEGAGIITKLDRACVDAYGEKGLGCQHGLGHGVLVEFGYEKLSQSLDLCKTLSWQEPIGGCTSGVFMEYNFNTMGDGEIRKPREDNLHYPCNVVDDVYGEACYFEQPQWWYYQTRSDYGAVGELCSEAPYVLQREACFRGVGNSVAGTREYDVAGMLGTCSLMPDEESRLLCIEGATWLMSAQPEFKGMWEEMCSALRGDAKTRCLDSKNWI